ncbi:HalOD1 output domain-containing protein [Halovivax sp.]|uniref:HalOD1 output domain-containing protein n=1 Tax=Halovivax sp. TaxID=1935978 RepID=UPI0025C18C23|nr:HalOD1 output domain-containing protein [Halovivax sp.]
MPPQPAFEERVATRADQLPAAVRDAVAAVEGVGPESLGRIDDVVDAEALGALFGMGERAVESAAGTVTFELSNCVVIVRHDGRVVALPRASAQVPSAETALAICDGGFGRVLSTVVDAAHRNGIDVCGSWSLRSDRSRPDWEVEITEVTKPYTVD